MACLLAFAVALVVLFGGVALAQPATTSTPDVKSLQERVRALENENQVLREDLGKARLDARADLEAAAKRQADLIAKTNQQLTDMQAKMEADKKAQARRNRNLWIGIALVGIGALASR